MLPMAERADLLLHSHKSTLTGATANDPESSPQPFHHTNRAMTFKANFDIVTSELIR